MALKLRRGLEADRTSITPDEGEIIYTTDQKQLFVGDGSTAGGTLVSSAVVSVNGQQGVVALTTDEVDEGMTNLYYSDLYVRAAISVEGAGGSYDSETGVITIDGGGGGATYNISAETATGGVNLRLTGSDASTDNVKLAQGSNITLTRTDANTITIASTASSSVQNLNDLIDVDAASPSNNQALVWHSGANAWQAADVGSGHVGSGVTNQLAFYNDTYTVTGSTKFTVDNSTGDLFVEGTVSTPFVLIESDSADAGIIVAKHHDTANENGIRMYRSKGTRVGKTAVDIADVVLTVAGEAYDGAQYVQGAEINSYVASSPVSSVVDLEATLSTGTSVVELTVGDTAGLIEGQSFRITSGTGEFGTNWDGSAAYIVSVDTPTQVTLSTDHSVAGAVVFNSLGLHPTALAFANTSSDGRLRKRLRIRENGAVNVGPDAGDFDGANHTGQLQVITMASGAHDYALGALGIRSCFDGVQGQEISFTRARGTIEQGGLVYTPAAVQTGDELGSIGFYGFYTPNPGVDNHESSRIIAEATGTVTSGAVPGKIRLQTANASGVMHDGLTVNHQQMTTFGGMAKLATYANETAAEAAVDNAPANGMMYYDTGANAAKMYGNGSWHALW